MAWSSYFWVRSAGFPFERLDNMGVLVQSEHLQGHEALPAARAQAEGELMALASAQAPESLPKLERRFREGGALRASELAVPIRIRGAALLDARSAALAQLDSPSCALQQAFQLETAQARRQLLVFLAEQEVREALFLSNPDALDRIDTLVERGVCQIDSRTRQRQRLGWNYAQRLCSKNDTSSFFGPIAWGMTKVLDRLGLALLDAVASAPRGRAARKDILAGLQQAGFDRYEAAILLDFLLAKTVLVAGYDIAPGSAQPLAQLARELRLLDVSLAAIEPWLALLDGLEARREDFARGGLEARAAALDAMRRLLSDAGIDLTRTQGQMYVGRFPVYEDCARNLKVELGGALAASLKTELEPVMALYGWLVGAVAVRMHEHYLARWHRIQDGAGGEIDFLRFVSGLGQRDGREQVQAEFRTSYAGAGVPDTPRP